MAVVTASVTDEPPLVVVAPPGPRSLELGRSLAATECPAFEERRKQRASLPRVAFGDQARGARSSAQNPRAGDAGASPGTIVLSSGRGSNLFDVDDNRYVDLAAGFGAAILGHGPSAAHDAATRQAGKLAQGLGDLYASDVKVALLARLAALLPSLGPSPGARVLLCQSGADAVTAALKTAALASGRPGVVAFEGAYHGLSYAPLAACGFRASFREPFASQLNPNVRFAPYPKRDADADEAVAFVRQLFGTGSVGTLLVEPVLGRGGVVVPPAGFLAALGDAARAAGVVVIADEIWTGAGRSGAIVRSLDEGLRPDIVCLGKGLGASFPISACIGTDAVMRGWARGGEVLHTSTHAGAPIGCAAALAVLDELERGEIAARAKRLGSRLVEALRGALVTGAAPLARDVRGAGLLVGVELARPGEGIAATSRLLERGWVVTAGGALGEVVVLTPPLTIDEDVLLGVVPVMVDVLSRSSR